MIETAPDLYPPLNMSKSKHAKTQNKIRRMSVSIGTCPPLELYRPARSGAAILTVQAGHGQMGNQRGETRQVSATAKQLIKIEGM